MLIASPVYQSFSGIKANCIVLFLLACSIYLYFTTYVTSVTYREERTILNPAAVIIIPKSLFRPGHPPSEIHRSHLRLPLAP